MLIFALNANSKIPNIVTLAKPHIKSTKMENVYQDVQYLIAYYVTQPIHLFVNQIAVLQDGLDQPMELLAIHHAMSKIVTDVMK
jgi:hypothetical protein